MIKLALDFETYYTREYSLRQMTTVEYIQHPLFECIGAAVALDNAPSKWLWGDQLAAFLAGLDPKRTIMVSHNIKFDGAILAWKFGFVPALYVDTLGMARALLAHKLARLSLDHVARHLGLGVKGTALASFMGFRMAQIKAHPARQDYIDYALNDNDLCRDIFTALSKLFPRNEFAVLDNIIRMFTCPQLTLDQTVLVPHLANVKRAKQELLDRIAHQNAEILQSNERFAAELMSLGVDPPKKISAKTGKEAWAFAKNDPGFKELANHDDPRVQNLVAARLGHMSTIEETRTQRFINIARLYPTWPDREAYIPIPLHYSGAHTHRLSGADGLNMQNLPRVDFKNPDGSGQLRRSLRAPKGYVIVSIDLSQIEARVVCWIAGADEFLHLFATGQDPYAHMGRKVGAMPMDAVKGHPEFAYGRQLGKAIILGCGFGMGGPKFRITAANAPYNLALTDVEALNAVTAYRTQVPEVPKLWGAIGQSLKFLAYREGPRGRYRQALRNEIQKGFVYEARDTTVMLEGPAGLHLKYENLHVEPGQKGEELWFEYQQRRSYIYGGKGTENLVQHFARCVIEGAAIEIRKQTGFIRAHQVHDENIFVVPEQHAEDFIKTASEITVKPPAYCLDLPLGCDAKMGHNYAEAH